MTADEYVEWSAQPDGRMVWLDDGTQVPETNWMAKAVPGDRTGPFELSPVELSGLPVWVRFDVHPPRTVIQATMWLAEKLARDAGAPRPDRQGDCTCEYVDIGIGQQKVAENPDCPVCTEFGYAAWAVKCGTPDEQAAAREYLAEVLGGVS
jgi:hypothetical protein